MSSLARIPSSFGDPAKGALSAEIGAIAENRGGWGIGLRLIHCHPQKADGALSRGEDTRLPRRILPSPRAPFQKRNESSERVRS